MTRDYFLETSTLLGLTFYSDRWFSDIRPLYDSGHSLHTSKLVLYEYCNRRRHGENQDPVLPDDPETLTLDWESDDGKYRLIEKRLKRPLPEYFRQIRRLGRDDLVLEDAIEAFVDHFEIREQAEPRIRSKFRSHFEERAVTPRYVNNFVQSLIDDILATAQHNREAIGTRLELHDSTYHERDDSRQRWVDLPDQLMHEPDLSILIDATSISSEGAIQYLVTGDSDFLKMQDIGSSYYDFSIVSILDEFAPIKPEPDAH